MMSTDIAENSMIRNGKDGILGWFARNPVTANLMMIMIMAGGLITAFNMRMEVFPELELDMIVVTVLYRGASPEDVEQGVCLRVEEAIAGIEGIKRIISTASEGVGTTTIEVEEYSNVQDVLDDVKAAVDRIITFPKETEKPVIAELKHSHSVITVVLYGQASEKTLRKLADEVRNDLTAMENITEVSVWGVRPYEISIEVSEEALRRYSLSFDKVAAVVGNSSIDLPAGSVKTDSGEILVRTEGQRYYGNQFEEIVVLTRSDGTKLRLRDIATVKDDFEDTDLYCRFDGKRAALVKVGRTGQQDAIKVADAVKKYIEGRKATLPEGISLSVWEDDTEVLKSRLNLLKKNAYEGLVLVFICIALFMDLRLAFWVTAAIPISFLGTFWVMPLWGLTINMMSLFAFITVLGMVVDNSIVIGEAIFTYREKGYKGTEAAVKGARELAWPVVGSVLTTIFAFIPLAYTAGIIGKILRILPIIVVSALSFSLLDALLILPAQLSGRWSARKNVIIRALDKIHIIASGKLEKFVNGPFKRAVVKTVKWRYVTLSVAVAIFLLSMGLVGGGYIKITFFDPVEADNMVATVQMPRGTPSSQTTEVAEQIETAAQKVRQEFDGKRENKTSIVRHISTTIGALPALSRQGPLSSDASGTGLAHLAEVNVELLGGEERDVSSAELKNHWREIVGEIPGVSSLTFTSEIFRAGDDIGIELSHEDFQTLLAATEKLKTVLRQYTGVSDIADSFEQGKMEMKLALNQKGRMSGLTLAELARQVRQGFYGHEVQRIQRGRDDIRVMVRYPKQQRKSLADVENVRIRLPNGTEIPFRTVAQVEYGYGFATINRVDRRRVVTVTGDVDEGTANASEINNDLRLNVLPKLMAEFPGLLYRYAGAQREQSETFQSLKNSFYIALLAIYVILAIEFTSYIQPLIVMSAIPFGLTGAILGHLVFGYNLSMLSVFGIIAMMGVVVNDSLIIIDLMNQRRKSGADLAQVVRDSATRRFRPIMLTTVTTSLALMPMVLERSLQARFLIPMAISLAFGVIFSAMITLFIVPSLYMVIEDVKNLFVKQKIS